MPLTPKLALHQLEEGQANAEVTVNDSFVRIDLFTHLGILDRDLTVPPGSPADGDLYLVDSVATAGWAGHDGELAGYKGGWYFQPLIVGMVAYVVDEDLWLGWNGSTWDEITVT